MTRADAEDRAAALNREHPERSRYRWLAHGSGDAWEVARVALAGAITRDPLTATVESRPRPEPREDPRPLFDKNVGGPWAIG